MNNVNIPEKDLLIDYYSKGYTMKDIANFLGMSTGKIHKYFKEYNIKVRKTGLSTDISKQKFREKVLGRVSPRKGIKLSNETKEKMSISKSGGIGKKSLNNKGYIRIYFPDHPKSDRWGYILEHVLIMECFIGRRLHKNEIVHHKNGTKTDNRIINLQLMTRNEHMKLHKKERNDN